MTTRFPSFSLLIGLTILMTLIGPGVGHAYGTPGLRDGSRMHLPVARHQESGHATSSAVLPLSMVLPPVQADNRSVDEDETTPEAVYRSEAVPTVRLPQSRAARTVEPVLSLLVLLCVLRC